MPSAEGVGARRAALQMLDAVLRRGQTLDVAGGAIRNLSPPDHGLAVAIAGEALRRLPDLDTLIDSATRQRLPDDSKARMVLRLALAQKVGLGTVEMFGVGGLPGLGRGRWGGAGPPRTAPPGAAPRRSEQSARPMRRAGGQDHAACRCRPPSDIGRRFAKPPRPAAREFGAH